MSPRGVLLGCISLLLLLACRTGLPQGEDQGDELSHRSPPLPSPQDLAKSCTAMAPHLAANGEPVPRLFFRTCPIIPRYRWQQIIPHTLQPAARLAVLSETEDFVVIPRSEAQPSKFTILIYFPDDDFDLSNMKEHPPAGAQFMSASGILPPSELQAYREQVAIRRENATYDECRSLILDIKQSTKDPTRAQACSNSMAAIDRAREIRQRAEWERRQEEYARQQMDAAEQQQEILENMRQELAATRQAQAKENRRRLIQDALRGFQAQPRKTSHCTPDLLGGMNCSEY